MGRGYLIVKEIPDNCSTCNFKIRTDEDYEYCGVPGKGFDYAVGSRYNPENTTPGWCPIHSAPKQEEHDLESSFGCGYALGWDQCIEEIFGKGENE